MLAAKDVVPVLPTGHFAVQLNGAPHTPPLQMASPISMDATPGGTSAKSITELGHYTPAMLSLLESCSVENILQWVAVGAKISI